MNKKTNSQLNKTIEETPYEELTLRNSFMFGKVMMDKSLCIPMLECLTGNTIDDVTEIVIEKTDKTTYDAKGGRTPRERSSRLVMRSDDMAGTGAKRRCVPPPPSAMMSMLRIPITGFMMPKCKTKLQILKKNFRKEAVLSGHD